jgi:hypothetical protein
MRAAATLLVLALALASTRAEVHVLEDFSDAQRFLGSTNRSSPARPSRAVADAPPPARPHISWALPEHRSYLQTSNTHVAVCQRISLPPPDE